MNEDPLKDYRNLIDALLNCNEGEEWKLLQANQELLDAHFIQMMQKVAKELEERGDKKRAYFLRDLVDGLVYQPIISQLLNCASYEEVWQILDANRDWVDARLQQMMLGVGKDLINQGDLDKSDFLMNIVEQLMGMHRNTSESQLDFLRQVLQATADSGGDPQVVYPLLLANVDKLDGKLSEQLWIWAKKVLVNVDLDQAKSLATVISVFSNLIQQFPIGNKANKMEIAITGYKIFLSVYTSDLSPLKWSGTQNSLGLAYLYRIKGDKGENLERAIACCQQALKVLTCKAFPQEWAQTQNSLGNAYSKRIRGDKGENLERAIICFQEALKIYTYEAFPQEWAQTQNSLGNAYSNRIRGDKGENLEQALVCYQQALKVRTCEAFPQDWAETQYNLGNAYLGRIIGDQAQNLEQALVCYQQALKVRTCAAFPQDWAQTQNSLGLVYSKRIKGDKGENLERAIACYQQALKICTYEAFPQDWATTQHNFGNAYLYLGRIKGDKGENLEQAIACYQQALKIYTYEAFPQDWARTQGSLGAVYSDRSRGDKGENLEQAIACYQQALKIYTYETFPQDWARTQHNFGNAYYYRIRGDKAENLEQAIDCYQQALKVRTREDFPQNHAETLWGLGIAYQDTNQLPSAYRSFASAVDTVELLREEIVSGEESKRKQAENFNKVYGLMVKMCIKLGNVTEAIEYVERSKTRNLVELILERDSKTIFPPEIVTQLEKYRDEIVAGQDQIQNGKAKNPNSLAQHLQHLRQQRKELQDRYLPVGSGFRFDKFQSTLDRLTAIIEWYITDEKILAFVIKPDGQELTVWQSQPEDREALVNWVGEYLQDYNKREKKQWRDKLYKRLKQLSEILYLESILDQIPEKQYDRLILIPHRFLHLLPLHALPVGKSYLTNRFPLGVGYAPSCQLLQQVQQRERPDFQSLFAIQNPTGDLEFTDQEVNSILSLFPSHQVLSNSYATKAALDEAAPNLQEVDYLHFSCHGSFNPDSPFLLLADAIVSSMPANADPKQYLESSKGFIDLSKCLTSPWVIFLSEVLTSTNAVL